MRALDGAWLNFPDGAPVAWLMRRFGARGRTARGRARPDAARDRGRPGRRPAPLPVRVDAGRAGAARRRGCSSAIRGRSSSAPSRRRSGPLTDEENVAIAQQIVDSGADVVWVGPRPAQAGSVARAQRGAVPAGGRPGRRRRLRLPRGHQAARAQVDAGRGPRVAAPADVRAAPAGAQVCGHEHRVRRSGPGSRSGASTAASPCAVRAWPDASPPRGGSRRDGRSSLP